MQERVAKLAGGVAVIKVGAATEIEMKEKKARVEDALHATRAAVEEGVVAGGGVALVRAIGQIEGLTGDNEDQNIGIAAALRAMEGPLRQIVAYAGDEASVVLDKVRHRHWQRSDEEDLPWPAAPLQYQCFGLRCPQSSLRSGR